MDRLEFAVEIFVTHEAKETKMVILKDLNLPAIETDLSHFYYGMRRNAGLTSPSLNLKLRASSQT